LKLPGRPKKLHTHVLMCDDWPISEKSQKNKTDHNSDQESS
ncbi:20071_t:CDS:1, partial [Gigaspora rosea]